MKPLSALRANEKIQIITLAFLTIFCIFIEIILHFYLGISTGYTHFFYILLVLAAIWYQRKAVILALCLAVTHFSIGFFVFDEPLWVPFLRSAMFVLVTLLVGIMSEGLKKAEKTVCITANEWEMTFNVTSDGICLLDKDQKIQRCNRGMVDILNGIPVKDLIGKPCWKFVHNTPGPIVECPFDEAKKTLTRQTVDVPEGKKWFEVTVDPILDGSGVFTGAVHIMRDITERKVMEESLRQSHQILQTILDTIPVRVFWKDLDLKYLGCNRPFSLDAGFSEPKELFGQDDYAMGWREQAEIYRADDRSVIASGTAKVMIEEPQKTPDGRTIWLLTSKVPLRAATGEISGVLGTYMDITEYHTAKEAIRESEEKYRAFFATSKDCVFITSKDGRFLDFNDETPAFFGYRNREEFCMVNVQDLYSDANERQDHINAIELSGFVKDYAVDLRKKDGSILHALITSVARKDILGKVIGFQGTIKDITEQKHAEDALKESNQRYISYIKEAAMRLKTPVEVVKRNIAAIIKDVSAGDLDNNQVLLELQLQVKNMEQIRQNILDLNKTIVDGYGEISPASKQFLTE